MIDEKKIKIEPYQALFQIGFKYGDKEGTVVIDNEFNDGIDSYITDCSIDLSKEEENKIINAVFREFLKKYSEKIKKDIK